MVPPSSLRIPRVHRYSGFRPPFHNFAYRAITVFGWASHPIRLSCLVLVPVRTPRLLLTSVWPISLSLAATRKISFDFSSSGYLDVSLPRVPRDRLCIHLALCDSSSQGLPHSEICGSKLMCSSPQLIAACRVLLRLLMPRHSPYALYSLN